MFEFRHLEKEPGTATLKRSEQKGSSTFAQPACSMQFKTISEKWAACFYSPMLVFLILVLASSVAHNAVAAEKGATSDPVRVVIWDERQPDQKKAYGGSFLGEAIAAHLKSSGNFDVRLQGLDDARQGLDETVLDFAEVIIWWGHVRHSKIRPETGQKIVDRIVAGQLSLIALHSSHFATPFVEAMNAKSRQEAIAPFKNRKWSLAEIPLRTRYYLPKLTEPQTPRTEVSETNDGAVTIKLYLPNCCFPAYADRGTPSQLKVLQPAHPIAKDIPAQFELPQTEMYADPFQVPKPDAVLFEESWKEGETFRSGLVWNLGDGKVFYFRPGHETYPIYRQPIPLKILSNAARWLAEQTRKKPKALAAEK